MYGYNRLLMIAYKFHEIKTAQAIILMLRFYLPDRPIIPFNLNLAVLVLRSNSTFLDYFKSDVLTVLDSGCVMGI